MKKILLTISFLPALNPLFSQIQVTQARKVFGPTGLPSNPLIVIQQNVAPIFAIMDTGYTILGTFSLPLPSNVYAWDIVGVSSDFDDDPEIEALYWVYDTVGTDHSYVVLRDIFYNTNQLEFNNPDSFYYAWTSYFRGERIFVVYNTNAQILFRSGVSVFVEENPGVFPVPDVSGMIFDRSLNPAEISFFMPVEGNVSIEVIDVTGRTVVNSDFGFFEAGQHRFYWQPRDYKGRLLPTGKYFVRINKDGTSAGETFIWIE